VSKLNRKWIALIVVALVVGAGVYYFSANLNSMVARVIETNGNKVTETDVNVSGVVLTLRDSRGSIDHLTVASPAGYHANDVFTLGNITVVLDGKSVVGNVVRIEEVHISAPVVFAEFTKTGSSNIGELRRRVEDYAGAAASGRAAKPNQKRIRIALLVLEKGRIEIDASALGVEKRTIDLPEIHVTDVGGTGGAAPDDIAKEILVAVARAATSELAHAEIHDLIGKQLGGHSVGDKVKSVLGKITP
jgi:hypothetical protein